MGKPPKRWRLRRPVSPWHFALSGRGVGDPVNLKTPGRTLPPRPPYPFWRYELPRKTPDHPEEGEEEPEPMLLAQLSDPENRD